MNNDVKVNIYKNIICPVCKIKKIDEEILEDRGSFVNCKNNHSFDRAKEGYLNLALSSKDKSGDNKEMVLSRKNFLNKGYFDILAEKLFEVIKEYNIQNLTDACCGEGYFTNKITELLKKESRYPEISGFDLSKTAILQASKQYKNILFFVANISHIPIQSASVQCLMHLFAPINEEEFYRILTSDGIFVHVFPAKHHLWQLKELLYDVPYENDENGNIPPTFKKLEELKVHSVIKIDNNEDINRLFMMTPYSFHTPEEGKARIKNTNYIETDIEFIINVCKKI